MKNIWKRFWPYIIILILWVVVAILCSGCNRGLKHEIEQLREDLARQQQYVPLKRDTIRDSIQMITQKIVEVEKIKEVLTAEDKDLLKDMGMKISAIESYQKMSTETNAAVTLSSSEPDSKSEDRNDSLLTYHDAWMDLKYNKLNQEINIRFQDSLAIAVEKEYKKKFLWWKWGTKGYQVKAVSFSPYSTIKYNTYVNHKR